jgi:hypothetical protein
VLIFNLESDHQGPEWFGKISRDQNPTTHLFHSQAS